MFYCKRILMGDYEKEWQICLVHYFWIVRNIECILEMSKIKLDTIMSLNERQKIVDSLFF